MKPKTIKILYWIITILFAVGMLMAGIVEAIQSAEGKEIMIHLGYPIYVLTILGVAKILGAFGILQQKFPILKEWAYAGFTMNFLGAFASRFYVNDSIGLIISPLLFLAVMFASYFLWKKSQQQKIA